MEDDYILFKSLDNRLPTFLGKSCQLPFASIHFVAALLYLSVFPFGVWREGGGAGRGAGAGAA